jgi:energy-coupling factor transport system permease protein
VNSSAYKSIFSTFHPVLIFAYLLISIISCFAFMHPIYILISFICLSSINIMLKGIRAFLSVLRMYIILVVVITAINALFVSTGNTIIFFLGTKTVTLEACIYGLCSGLMLCNALICFSNWNELLCKEKFLYLFASVVPTISMLISMILSFVPKFIAKGRMIYDSQLALVGLQNMNAKTKTKLAIRTTNVLAGLSMEDSIETAAAMKAKGYGASKKRSSYERYAWKFADTLLACVLLVLLVLNLAFAIPDVANFSFYPSVSSVPFSFGYIFYALILLLPLLVEGGVALCRKL